MAVQLEVGYTEDEEVYVDIQPVSELEDVIDDALLAELEGVAYSEADKLDTLVASFTHCVYDFLYGHDQVASLLYTKYSDYLKLEQSYKASSETKKSYVPMRFIRGPISLPFSPFPPYSSLLGDNDTDQKCSACPLLLLSGYRAVKESIDETEVSVNRSNTNYLLRWEAKYSDLSPHCAGDVPKQLKLLQELYMHEQRTVLGKAAHKVAMLTDNELWCWSAIVIHIARSIRLKNAIFSHTRCNTFVIPAYARYLTHLTECNLSQNQLVVIPQELTFLPNLRKLILSFNRIRILPPLGGCPKLEVLDCHTNEITALPPDLGSLTNLQTLDLEYNKVVVIPEEIVKLTRLQFLGLTKNNVKLIPPQLGTISSLVYLKLMHNPIVNLPAHIYVQGTQKTLAYLKDYIPEAAHITQSSLVSDLAKFANRELFSDLILRVTKDKDGKDMANGPTFFAHRVVIDGRCPSLYKSTLNLEEKLRSSLTTGSVADASADETSTQLSIALSQATISSLPSDAKKAHFDAQNRLIVDVDVTEQELKYLLAYIYGDVFEPARPEIVNVPTGSEDDVANAILAANAAALKQYHTHCEDSAKLAARFGLARMEQLAKQLASPSEKVPATTYFDDLHKFAAKPKHSDVAFMVDGRTIPTHKVIICARSEYFNNMLTGGLLESTLDVVPLPDDVRYAVAKSVIEFCYNDDLNCTAETIMELLMLSRVYGIERLKGMVETIVGYSLDAANAPSIYSIAELYSFKRLRKACRYFILSNWHAVTAQEIEWNELDADTRERLTAKAKDWGVI